MNCKLCNDFIYSGHIFKNNLYCPYCYDTIIQTIATHLETYQYAVSVISDAQTAIDKAETKTNKICKAVTLQESQRTASGNSTEDRVVDFVDLRSEMDVVIMNYTEKKQMIESNVSLLNNGRLKTILQLKYLNGLSICKIAQIEQCCPRTIQRELRRALHEYGEINNLEVATL